MTAIRKVVISTIAILACSSANASDWVAAGEADHLHDFVDRASLRKSGSVRKAWIKRVYDPGAFKHEARDVAHAISLVAFNCSEATARREAVTFYFADGSTFIPDYDLPSPWAPVTPDTVQEVDMKYVCAWKAP